jgi:hypothetical protein
MCGIANSNTDAWSCSNSCQIASCSAGFFDIDGDVSNGCECKTDQNPQGCGGGVVSVATGGSASLTGVVETAGGEDWFQVQFATTAVGQGWHPQLALGGAFAGEYIFDVFDSCGGPPTSCNNGGNVESGQGVTQWETQYNGYVAGPGCCGDNVARPAAVFVRVRRRNGDAATCHPFEITASNP